MKERNCYYDYTRKDFSTKGQMHLYIFLLSLSSSTCLGTQAHTALAAAISQQIPSLVIRPSITPIPMFLEFWSIPAIPGTKKVAELTLIR